MKKVKIYKDHINPFLLKSFYLQLFLVWLGLFYLTLFTAILPSGNDLRESLLIEGKFLNFLLFRLDKDIFIFILLTVLFSGLLVAIIVVINKNILTKNLESNNHHIKNISYFTSQVIEKRRRPLVWVEETAEGTAREAANLVRSSIKEEPISGYRLIFIGAVAIQSFTVNSYEEDYKNISPNQIYHGALEEIASKEISVGRFVYLPPKDILVLRSHRIRKRYIAWLKSQRGQMRRNTNYRLISTPRAPAWGTATGSIVTASTMIQLTQKNGASLIVKDRRIIKALIKETTKEMNKSKNIQTYSKEKFEASQTSTSIILGLKELENLIKEMEKCIA